MLLLLSALLFISGVQADECACCATRWNHQGIRWTCPDNEFCGTPAHSCSGSDFGLFRCNSTMSCPAGLECCATGPASRGPSTNYSFCRNATAGDTCCGKHAPPCSSDERCCLSEPGFQGVAAAAAFLRRAPANTLTSDHADVQPANTLIGDDGNLGWVDPYEGFKFGFNVGLLDWCVPAQTGQCCNDGVDELLFTCSEGKCCGRPWRNGTIWQVNTNKQITHQNYENYTASSRAQTHPAH